MCGLDVKQTTTKKRIKTSLENGVFESSPLRKIKWSEQERKRKEEIEKGRKTVWGRSKRASEESERCPQHYGTQSMKSHRLKR